MLKKILLINLMFFTHFGFYLLSAPKDNMNKNSIINRGAITCGDTTKKQIALVFTGDEYADGGTHIKSVLRQHNINASFFFTGNFYRNQNFVELIKDLISDGHYLGAHSDKHLLYCSWENRDNLLVNKTTFFRDLEHNYIEMAKYGISKSDAHYFMPPYEWYNQTISNWTNEYGLQLINYTPGTRTNADYTIPSMGKRYIDSKKIYDSIIQFEKQNSFGLNGFILLIHIGTHPERTDKFYLHLSNLIKELKRKNYTIVTIKELLD